LVGESNTIKFLKNYIYEGLSVNARFSTLVRHLSDPNIVEISVYSSISAIMLFPSVSYNGTVVIPNKLHARSVVIHSSQFTDVIPATFNSLSSPEKLGIY
jgi:hypothetical protein